MTLAFVRAALRLIRFAGLSKVIDNRGGIVHAVEVDGASVPFEMDYDTKTLTVGFDGDLNESYVVCVLQFHFASAPVSLPYDLNEGREVFFEPTLVQGSEFGPEIDTINQSNEAIEGSGTLSLIATDWWRKNFDKLTFENQKCEIYSWSTQLTPSEAYLIFRGKTESRSYGSLVGFKLKDAMTDLRASVVLKTMAEVPGARLAAGDETKLQRMIIGRVRGHLPVNIDAAVDGLYPLPGTIEITGGLKAVTGTGTEFLKHFTVGDKILIRGQRLPVATIVSNIELTIEDAYDGASVMGEAYQIEPSEPKRWMNRIWKVAGHPLRDPRTLTLAGSTVSRLLVADSIDIFAGDEIMVGEYVVTVASVPNRSLINLAESLPVNPSAGTLVVRPCVQNLRIGKTKLRFFRDFVLNPMGALIVLREEAERDAGEVFYSKDTVTFTAASRTVTGSGTKFTEYLRPGHFVRAKGESDFYCEVLEVTSDTQFVLRQPAIATVVDKLEYKTFVLDDDSVISCDVLGRTPDSVPTTPLARTGTHVMRMLLRDILPESEIDLESFDRATPEVGFVIPPGVGDKSTPTYRDLINSINRSVNGVLYQTKDFKLAHRSLNPSTASRLRLTEADCLKATFDSTAKNMVSRVVASHSFREYDFETNDSALLEEVASNVDVELLWKSKKEKRLSTVLIDAAHAKALAWRWAFLLEKSSGRLIVETKLQAIESLVGDVLELSHEKFFERFGGTSKKKIVFIESAKKSGLGVTLECVDLSNSFNRVAFYAADGANSHANSSDDERSVQGFYKDDDGVIDGDDETYFSNLLI